VSTEQPAETGASTGGDPGRTVDHVESPDTIDHRPAAAPGGGPAPAGLPARFGNYELREELGRGGMGVVFRAVQDVAGREVAVKVLLGGAAGGALHGGRFAAEVSALARLRHPNIVTVYEVGEVGGSAFFSMEYAPDGTLAGRLKGGPLPFPEAAAAVGKLAAAAGEAHRLGVLHRDIKPGNVLIGADGEPKLSDFGLAKWADRDEGLTASGAVLGTPSYMAPEQARGAADVGPAADVYALGATLYECLTGRPPFRGKDTYSILQLVLAADPAAPRSVRPDVPPELEAICLKCLDKDPARRYAAAKDLADDLTRWRNGESTVARPLRRRQRAWRWVRRRRRPLAAAAVLLAAVGATYALAPRRDRPVLPDVPPPPVAVIEAALKRGETVPLIGPGGPPKYQRWAVGTGTSDAGPDQPVVVQCSKSGLLELTPDSHNDRFRLTAEFQQNKSFDQHSGAGVYFGHKAGVPGPVGSADRVMVIWFRDDMVNDKPFHPVLGNPLQLIDYVVFPTETDPFHFYQGDVLAQYWVKEKLTQVSTRPWRKVVAEVTPDAIRVYWKNPDGSMRPIPDREVRTAELNRRWVEGTVPHLKKVYPGVETAGLDYSPRGGVGLYLNDARAYFKNVVLEPLAP
jgi:serine/threonine-protein kinase